MKELTNTEILGLCAAIRGMDANARNELWSRLEKLRTCPRCKRIPKSPWDDKSPFYCQYCGQKITFEQV